MDDLEFCKGLYCREKEKHSNCSFPFHGSIDINLSYFMGLLVSGRSGIFANVAFDTYMPINNDFNDFYNHMNRYKRSS